MTSVAFMKQPPTWTFGDRVRKVRREMRWSQSELAGKLGDVLGTPLSGQAVGGWELSNSQPADVVAAAKALQEITEVPAEWFLGLVTDESA